MGHCVRWAKANADQAEAVTELYRAALTGAYKGPLPAQGDLSSLSTASGLFMGRDCPCEACPGHGRTHN